MVIKKIEEGPYKKGALHSDVIHLRTDHCHQQTPKVQRLL